MATVKETPIKIIRLEQERKREPVKLILVGEEPKPREEPVELKIVWT